jgi:hypothetical protein
MPAELYHAGAGRVTAISWRPPAPRSSVLGPIGDAMATDRGSPVTTQQYIEALRYWQATDDEIKRLVEDTALGAATDAEALAYERLAALRGVPYIVRDESAIDL